MRSLRAVRIAIRDQPIRAVREGRRYSVARLALGFALSACNESAALPSAASGGHAPAEIAGAMASRMEGATPANVPVTAGSAAPARMDAGVESPGAVVPPNTMAASAGASAAPSRAGSGGTSGSPAQSTGGSPAAAAGSGGATAGGSADKAGTGGAGGAGGANAVSVPTVPLVPGEPIQAKTPMKWQYVAFPKTQCLDGSSTGLAINVNPSSDKLLFYLDEGGGCFNDTTCAISRLSWSERDMRDPQQVLSSRTGLLSRTETNSPFGDWNMVFIPYCSGDAHMGTNPSGYNGMPQVGYLNLTEFLSRVVPTFPKLSQVVLTGTSAGGFGASYNWLRVQDAFGSVPVHLLNDSGPPVSDKYVSPCMQEKLNKLWGLEKSVHPACTECDAGSGHAIGALVKTTMARLADTRRIAILSNDEDATMRVFFGYALNDCANIDDLLPPSMPMGVYPQALKDLRESLSAYPNFAMYLLKGEDHIMLFDPGKISSAGVKLKDFLQAFVTGGPDYKNVVP